MQSFSSVELGCSAGGFDLPTMGKGAVAAREMLEAGAKLLMAIYNHPKPIVIGCGGHAIAMGTFITMAGDERIGASGEFKLGMNETAIGMTLPTFGLELARGATFEAVFRSSRRSLDDL